jgi:Sap, sulfolipid-1-addressing protein
VLAQAAGLALLAGLSPPALLVASVYLGSARPRLTALCYLAGALLVTTVIAIVALVALRSGNLQLPGNRTPRYGLRLGLGLLILGAAVVVARRRPSPPDPSQSAKGITSRLVANPAPATALVAGGVLFGPQTQLTFVAAVQVIATARASVALTTLGLAMIIAIDMVFVWLPLLVYLAAPELAARRLAAFNAWLGRHGRTVLAGALAVAGAFLVINGLAGLIRWLSRAGGGRAWPATSMFRRGR